MSRWAHRTVLVCAALVIASCFGVVLYAVWPFISGGGLASEITQIRAKGEPVSAADLAGPRVADADNAAPIYARISGVLAKQRSRHASGGGRATSATSFVDNSPEGWRRLRAVVDSQGSVLAMAREAALKPKCRFPARAMYGIESGYGRLNVFRTVADLLAAQAVLAARDGDMNKALECIDVMLRITNHVRARSTMMPFLVRTRMLETISRTLPMVVEHHPISRSQIRALDQSLAAMDVEQDFVKAMQGERALGIQTFEELRAKGTKQLEEISADFSRDSPVKASIPGGGLIRVGLRPDEAYYIREMTRRIEAARKPFRLIPDEQTGGSANPDAPRYAVVSRLRLSYFRAPAASRDTAIAAVAGSRIMLWLAEYHSVHKAYPRTLHQLSRELRRSVPDDPFSGAPFRYGTTGEGYTLYSIGPNLKDEGGLRPVRWEGRRSNLRAGDIVWSTDK